MWESLGDAYFLRGSYSAALNTYNKALELDPNSMYAKLKVGVVYQVSMHTTYYQTKHTQLCLF